MDGDTFATLLKQADDYADKHPENYRSILNNFEQVWAAAEDETQKALAKASWKNTSPNWTE